ncbi:hypothetical protein RchiOBHm_Chr6g0278581 [Rosa chinensis]|uniref:Uncharacterized protein n=1 Tax=Rosa chinensis TaxID=74649 RepID=A0A2P6PST7_ROSCH|nr:hypothetical protein RchiOBHm_Chr6g0278581 [Rosa chinensis]
MSNGYKRHSHGCSVCAKEFQSTQFDHCMNESMDNAGHIYLQAGPFYKILLQSAIFALVLVKWSYCLAVKTRCQPHLSVCFNKE